MICRFLPDFGCFCAVLGVWYFFWYYIFMFGIMYEMNISLTLNKGLWGGCGGMTPDWERVCFTCAMSFFCLILAVFALFWGMLCRFFGWFWLFLRCFGGMLCLFHIIFLGLEKLVEMNISINLSASLWWVSLKWCGIVLLKGPENDDVIIISCLILFWELKRGVNKYMEYDITIDW